MLRRLTIALIAGLLVLAQPASTASTTSAADGEAPAVGTPAFTPVDAAAVAVSVEIDTHNAETVVKVEYVTAGAYRGQRVPGAATTVTIATVTASAGGPATVTGQVTGLDPGATYRMLVKASNVGGETLSADVTIKTPAAPKPGFKAKVGKNTTKITKLTVARLMGGETVRLSCKAADQGCPFKRRTIANLVDGTLVLSPLVKTSSLEPGAKLTLQVLAHGTKLSTLTLIIRDDQQPKVKRN